MYNLKQNIEREAKPLPSNVNNNRPVPETVETVIIVVAASPLAVAGPVRHETVVPDDHDVVAQSTDARLAVGVALMDAKARPPSVAVVPPEGAALPAPTGRWLTVGAAGRSHTARPGVKCFLKEGRELPKAVHETSASHGPGAHAQNKPILSSWLGTKINRHM